MDTRSMIETLYIAMNDGRIALNTVVYGTPEYDTQDDALIALNAAYSALVKFAELEKAIEIQRNDSNLADSFTGPRHSSTTHTEDEAKAAVQRFKEHASRPNEGFCR